jgi:hypothetical protein
VPRRRTSNTAARIVPGGDGSRNRPISIENTFTQNTKAIHRSHPEQQDCLVRNPLPSEDTTATDASGRTGTELFQFTKICKSPRLTVMFSAT